MSTSHGTIPQEMPGWYFQFLADVITQLPRPGADSGCITEARALQFHDNRGVLKEALHEALLIREARNKYLKLLSAEPIVIGPCDGSETLAEARDVFKVIDTDFERWGTNKRGCATGSTPVWVCELREDATFAQMLGNPDRVCFSQHQVKKFCRENPQYLSPSAAIFIPFRVEAEKDGGKDQFFVAFMRMGSDGALKVGVFRFGVSIVWRADDRPRVVISCLPAGTAQLAV